MSLDLDAVKRKAAANSARLSLAMTAIQGLATDAGGNPHGLPFQEVSEILDRLQRWKERSDRDSGERAWPGY